MENVPSPKPFFEVTVGNIGTVYSGHFKENAERIFHEYVAISNLDYGRASGEDVILWMDGEITKEHIGKGGCQ